MKFLQVDSLDLLNSVFEWESAEAQLTGRIEAYSCKSAGSDKKLFKHMENKYNMVLSGSISPDEHIPIISPFGRLDESAPRKTFFYLLATLNAAFPDNDFSDVRPDQFSKQPAIEMVINSVNTTLFNLGNDFIVNKYRMWDILDEIVELNECDVYSYTADIDDDPMVEEGYLWSMNYFFFNRKLKRMVFFSVNSRMKEEQDEDEDDNEGDNDIDSGTHQMDDDDDADDDDFRYHHHHHHHHQHQMVLGDMEV